MSRRSRIQRPDTEFDDLIIVRKAVGDNNGVGIVVGFAKNEDDAVQRIVELQVFNPNYVFKVYVLYQFSRLISKNSRRR